MSAPARVALVGVHGHGATYLDRLDRLAGLGMARLVAVADPRPARALAERCRGARWYATLDLLLAGEVPAPDVVVIATPIGTHRSLAEQAMRAGCDVLVEKPTTATLADFLALQAVADQTGRLCQVGFQTFGSEALPMIDGMLRGGEIGEVTHVGAQGTWVRTHRYWTRVPWAGRRHLDGRPVVDGVVTNPLAHAVATALRVAGTTKTDDVTGVELDLYRANDIEADDTSSGVITTATGETVSFGLTLCAVARRPAMVVVRGSMGCLRLWYESDRVEVDGTRSSRSFTASRIDLLRNLIDARAGRARLRSSLADTGAFMSVLEAVRLSPDPRPVPAEQVTWIGEGADRRPVIADVETWCERAAAEGRTFAALGAPWTR